MMPKDDIRTCERCGKGYNMSGRHPDRPNRFCSIKCNAAARRVNYPKTCRACGGTFYRRDNEGSTSYKAREYCSQECRKPAQLRFLKSLFGRAA